MEKNEMMPLLFTDDDLEVMRRLRDAFNPNGVLNPQKIFPTARACREIAATPALTDAIVGSGHAARMGPPA